VFGYRDLMSPWACHYAAQRQIPYCLEPLGSLLPQLRSFRKKWLYDKTIGRVIVGGAARLIAASDQERNDIIGLGVPPLKVMCRPNAVHLCDFADLPARGTLRQRLGIPDDGAVILFMSRINPIKGLERLIRAFEQMPASASLVVAGPAEDPAHLKQMGRLTAELGLESRVHFIGPVFGRDKLQALVDADIFALPSDRENFGVAAAEAVACGIPVVVTSTCGIGPMIKDRAGIVVEPAIVPLTRAIRGLVDHPETREKLALGCREVRETLGWEGPLRIQEEIYSDLAGRESQTALT
jgi:glycosyltransferase involved in cell wall biosynthesis